MHVMASGGTADGDDAGATPVALSPDDLAALLRVVWPADPQAQEAWLEQGLSFTPGFVP